MSNAASDISVRERDTSRRFKKGWTRRVREKEREGDEEKERNRESPTNQVLYREKKFIIGSP